MCKDPIEYDPRRMRTILQQTDFSSSLMDKHHETKAEYLEYLVRHPERISRTHELQICSRTVTLGFKLEETEGSAEC